ncbi:2-oxoglutarate ferredoxin oxidoreductase subunit beta [Parafrankia irregularis]|uniref:2-oxoglutarate ferredoxin oxidoreductase subunit beta n=1 Tax=Parafrankia irregularis TaxID=795642 RepID=A0A0S4QGN1_9ACTN|nr:MULTISPECIES: 2-oxoacid:ferredoxin oxidoreductase subunit beta [Parafrankia]EFC85599.1 thiamine pyrophosphate protein domain protein TPP-binding [Parafrankia sp. EUN1f]MBE3203088.1 2-oxoacid:ferredoxin oxidoreductase subunit beta [Parafrankia sp. CH37]CUU54274.1 2-oxoglutarate ferredoxin oxidoreductase subunit beta [Parafrankia irregularis]
MTVTTNGSGISNRLLDLIPATPNQLTRKDFTSDQEVRWCPGCGDYAILATVQGFLPELGIARENIAFISGIGCSSRFPYYLQTYGMHSIHGRAPAIATGLATSRPDLSVWVVTGDGDALSIGGNHLLHAMRRNVNIKILMFNNRIYGLTKGQYSPTSEVGKITKSTPFGSLDRPYNPASLALGAEATFVARSIDSDRAHLTATLRAAAEHPGTAFVEIFQNCNIFNDGAFEALKDRDTRDDATLKMVDGEPLLFGAERDKGIRRAASGGLEVCAATDENVLVHDAANLDPSQAFALSRLTGDAHGVTPIGVFRNVDMPTYDEALNDQVAQARTKLGKGDLLGLISGNETWTIN